MFRLSLLKVVLIVAIIFVIMQLNAIFQGKISKIGPISQADKNIVFQGHNSEEKNDSEIQPAEPNSKPNNFQSNTGNVAVGFGENAPQNVPIRAGMPKVDQPSSIFSGSAPGAANSNRGQMGAPQETFHQINFNPTDKKRPKQGEMRLKSALNSADNSEEKLNQADSIQLTKQMAQAHLKTHSTATDNSEAIKPGYSDAYMKTLQKNNKQRVNNDYERCLIAILLLEKAGGTLALTPAQARYVLNLIEEAENDKYAETKAIEKIEQLLSKEQKLYINKNISRKPLYANGPVEEDPTQASLKKAIDALEQTSH